MIASPVNNWPLNQSARRRLVEAKAPVDPQVLYLVQLLQLGFEAELTIPGQGQGYRADLELAANQLSNHRLVPAQVMRWLLSNQNTGEQSEQNDTLKRELDKAADWREAAQNLMQWFYDLKASQDPYYRPAPRL
jgi:hypothetical protein